MDPGIAASLLGKEHTSPAFSTLNHVVNPWVANAVAGSEHLVDVVLGYSIATLGVLRPPNTSYLAR